MSVLFADNYWIIAMSVQELQKANAYWQQCLEEAGWHTPAKDLRYCTTLFDDQFTKSSVTYGGEVVSRVPRKVGFKALGTQITFNNRCDVELDRRIKAAWGAFSKYYDILCCKVVHISKRPKYFAIRAGAA